MRFHRMDTKSRADDVSSGSQPSVCVQVTCRLVKAQIAGSNHNPPTQFLTHQVWVMTQKFGFLTSSQEMRYYWSLRLYLGQQHTNPAHFSPTSTPPCPIHCQVTGIFPTRQNLCVLFLFCSHYAPPPTSLPLPTPLRFYALKL